MKKTSKAPFFLGKRIKQVFWGRSKVKRREEKSLTRANAIQTLSRSDDENKSKA
jgi:hypothetical protein